MSLLLPGEQAGLDDLLIDVAAAAIADGFDGVPGRVRVRHPLGRWQRGSVGGKYMAQFRKERRARDSAKQATQDLTSLAKAWNKKLGLRLGDEVQPDGGARDSGWRHPNTWTVQGVVKVAFDGLGRSVVESRPHGEIEVGAAAGGMNLAATSVVASIWMDAQSGEVDALVDGISRRRFESVFLGSHYDSTPTLVSFGALQEMIMPHARYLHLGEDNRWRALPLDKYSALTQRAAPKVGVVELFAQRMAVSFHDAAAATDHHRDIFVPPRFVQNNKASTTYDAVNKGVLQFSIEAIGVICKSARFLMLSEFPDNHKGNKRKMFFSAAALPSNCFFIPGGCTVHLCCRIIDALGTVSKGMLGDVYSAKFVCHLAAHYNRLYRVLKLLLEDELEVVPRRRVRDADLLSWRAHAEAVVAHTLMRKCVYTRGRLDDEDDALHPSHREDFHREQAQQLLDLCRGDWRMQKVVHICDGEGCCSSREETVEKVFAAMTNNGALLQGSGLPAKSKWGSMTTACAETSFGVLFHGVLPRAFARAFPDWDSGEQPLLEDAELGLDQDFQNGVKRKVYRVGKFLGSLQRVHPVLQTSWVAEPIDWLWQRLQYLDENQQSLIDVCNPDRDPFRAAVKRSSQMLLQPMDIGHLAPLLSHVSYGRTAAEQETFLAELQSMVASVVCQLHWRFVVTFAAHPFPLASLADSTLIDEEILEAIRALYRLPSCCLDATCSQKMRAFFPTCEDMFNDLEFRRLIKTWTRRAKLCNMHLERQLALVRSSAPRRLPNAERLCAAGLLAMVNQKHQAAGGSAPGSLKRSQLLAEGVPLASRARARRADGRARGHITFMKNKVGDARALKGGKLTAVEQSQIRRDASAEYAALSNDDRLALQREAIDNARARPAADAEKFSRYNLDGELLWGLSRQDTPFDEGKVQAVIQDVCGLDQAMAASSKLVLAMSSGLGEQ